MYDRHLIGRLVFMVLVALRRPHTPKTDHGQTESPTTISLDGKLVFSGPGAVDRILEPSEHQIGGAAITTGLAGLVLHLPRTPTTTGAAIAVHVQF